MITGKVVGDETLILRLNTMGPRLRERLKVAVTREAVALTRYVKEQKLSGQVLRNRTGTLRRKINYVVNEGVNDVTATVGVKLAYAGIHEYGFDGTETVREHLRTITQAFGRTISPVQVTVREFSRHMHMPARSFLRSSLQENAPAIRDRLTAAIVDEAKK